jgi:hypothetical protein
LRERRGIWVWCSVDLQFERGAMTRVAAHAPRRWRWCERSDKPKLEKRNN